MKKTTEAASKQEKPSTECSTSSTAIQTIGSKEQEYWVAVSKPQETAIVPEKTDIPQELVQSTYPQVSTLEIAISTPSVSLCQTKMALGEKKVLTQLMKQVSNLDIYLGLKNGITGEANLELSKMILADFPYITFADFALVMNRARRGYYGKLYEHLSPSDIYKWVSDYFEEKCDQCEKMHIEESQSMKGSTERTKVRIGSASVATLTAMAEMAKKKNIKSTK